LPPAHLNEKKAEGVLKSAHFEMLEFVDKERVTIDGRKRTGDLLIKTRFQGQAAGLLIHLEHQRWLWPPG